MKNNFYLINEIFVAKLFAKFQKFISNMVRKVVRCVF